MVLQRDGGTVRQLSRHRRIIQRVPPQERLKFGTVETIAASAKIEHRSYQALALIHTYFHRMSK